MVNLLKPRNALLAVSMLILTGVPVAAGAQDQTPAFDAAQEQDIREIVRDYLLENPEVLIEAINVYRDRQRVAAQERQKEALKEMQSALASDPDTPTLGNPEGDVQIVEFFDYNCGYCKSVAGGIRQTIADDPGIRLVMKEYPILGPASQFAARAALAAAKQGRYDEFHFTLMTASGKLSEAMVMAVAEDLGLDVERLRKDMEKPEVDAALRRNFELAEGLEITGTPAFVIGSQVYPGALDMETLRRVVAETRTKGS